MDNLQALHAKVHRGAYRAKPSRRVYIPKPDGRQRPLGIAALEDKILQSAVVSVMNAIYESDFLGFSYGFRPGRGAHDALDALAVGITDRKVNWVLDADIRGFFDTIDHRWLIKFIEHCIADRGVLRLIQKWLRAGVMEQGKRMPTDVGSPQGATVSPCWPTSVYIMRWICGFSSGDGGVDAVTSSSCATLTTSCWAFNMTSRQSGSSESFVNDLRGSDWNCTRTRPGLFASEGLPLPSAKNGANPVHRRPSTSSG